MVKEYDGEDLRKPVSTQKKHFLKPKCAVTGKTEITAPLQVDHIVECQAVAVCINLLQQQFSAKKTADLAEVIREHWINSEFFFEKYKHNYNSTNSRDRQRARFPNKIQSLELYMFPCFLNFLSETALGDNPKIGTHFCSVSHISPHIGICQFKLAS